MGIRFLCPNGHKLNVKAFLAGKRGICPQCDAKFLVPHESGGQAGSIAGEAIVETVDASGLTPLVQQSEVATATAGTTGVSSSTAELPEQWHVRTAAGEQFGPAEREVMLTWVSEGRVTDDCWVWRTGWPDWKSSKEALPALLPAPQTIPPPVPPPAFPKHEDPKHEDVEPNASSDGELTSATLAYRLSRRNRQDRARKATLFLGVVVVLLLVVLVVVLINNSR